MIKVLLEWNDSYYGVLRIVQDEKSEPEIVCVRNGRSSVIGMEYHLRILLDIMNVEYEVDEPWPFGVKADVAIKLTEGEARSILAAASHYSQKTILVAEKIVAEVAGNVKND